MKKTGELSHQDIMRGAFAFGIPESILMNPDYMQAIKRLIDHAVASEREACAKLADLTKYRSTLDLSTNILNCDCANAIRKMGHER